MPIEDSRDRHSTLQGDTSTEAFETQAWYAEAALDGRGEPGVLQPAKRFIPNFVRALHGELDISQKQSIEEEFGRIERLMPSVVILDLSDVGYLDTTFINALMRTKGRLLKNTDNCLRIVAPSKSFVSRIFAITKLDADFDLFEDLSSAQRYARDP